jgi:hypothetical protein
MKDLELFNLPHEMLFKILLYLPLSATSNFYITCHLANQIYQTDSFWRMMFKRDFGGFAKPESTTWREYYKLAYLIEPCPSISAGRKHYGITDDKGDLSMGGNGLEGQIGGGEETKKKKNPPTKVELESKIICISCNDDANGVVTEDGKVYIWGVFYYQRQRNLLYTPRLVPLDQPALKISVTRYGYVIILKDRSVYYNIQDVNYGYIGNIRTRDVHVAIRSFAIVTNTFQVYLYHFTRENKLIFTEVPFIEPIRKFICTKDNTMALSLSGDLYVSGDNQLGQLGQCNLIDSVQQVKVNLGKKITFIALHEKEMMAITNTGEFYIWGGVRRMVEKSVAKEIGILNSFGNNMIATPTIFVDFKSINESDDNSSPDSNPMEIMEIAIGDLFVMALVKGREIKIWGNFPRLE